METSIKYHPVAHEFSVYIDTEFVGCGFSYYEAEEILENALYNRVKRQWVTVKVTDILSSLVETHDLVMSSDNISQAWKSAVSKAFNWLVCQNNVSYNVKTNQLTVHSASRDKVYIVDNACQCEAYEAGKACWHRAAARLVRRAMEK